MFVIICDDDKIARKELREHLQTFSNEHGISFDITEQTSGEALIHLFQEIKEFPALVILDVYMKEMTGIETAEKLRKMGYKGELILSTTSKDHMLDGYDVMAIGYVVKPCTYEKIEKALLRVCERRKEELKTLTVVEKRINRKIRYRDIIYVESEGRYVVIHTGQDDIRCIGKMYEMEEQLCAEKNFLRCHRGCIVNMNYIKAPANDYLLMKNGDRVPINIKESIHIRQIIADYFFQSLKEE